MKHIIAILMILLCAAPVSAANVAYPQEYYDLNNIAQKALSSDGIASNPFAVYYHTGNGFYASYLELRRQTILMEKQNELQAELVKAQWVDTCYASENTVTMGNRSAWKSECASAGYPVG